jgi:phospho-N-acetylmuramoyl-pentapeptide-transferase
MGGIAMIGAAVAGYLLAHIGTHVHFSRAGVLLICAISAFALIGGVDDWLKIRFRRSLGLNKRAKLFSQLGAGSAFAALGVNWVHVPTTLSFTRAISPGIQLGSWGWGVLAVFVMVGASNAVNLTDGLDGLASGSATFCFAVLAIIGYWVFRHPRIFAVVPADAINMALVAAAMAGGCLGFLWWNAAPARIMMGDTGSLSLGAGLAGVSLLCNLDLLLPILGGLFVIETLSVIAQVFSFRVLHRRVLRMAPIHHHFELLGWPETTVIIRFWIIAGLFAALALGLFYGEYLLAAHL